jgi:hypothetical protein
MCDSCHSFRSFDFILALWDFRLRPGAVVSFTIGIGMYCFAPTLRFSKFANSIIFSSASLVSPSDGSFAFLRVLPFNQMHLVAMNFNLVTGPIVTTSEKILYGQRCFDAS